VSTLITISISDVTVTGETVPFLQSLC